MPWSEEQLRAIETKGKNLLVSAAAGSGKTSVLVERIIRRILSGDFDVDRLLVVTFTKAAAAEMRERIEAALQAQLEKTPESGRLQRQLVLLSNASISTIDSFCQNVIRQNFHAIDLDPKFRLANEQELAILRQEVLEALFEREYDAKDPAFLDFVERYASEKGDAVLYEIVLRLFHYSRSQAFPSLWLDSLSQPFALSDTAALKDTIWYPMADAEIGRLLSFCQEEYERLLRLSDALDFEAYRPNFEEESAWISRLIDIRSHGSWDELQQAVQAVAFPRMKPAPRGTEDSLKRKFTGPREDIKKTIQYLQKKYFMVTEEELLRDLRAAAPDVAELCALAHAFADDFAAAKRERTLVDFSDLEHFALDILRSEQAAPGELLPGAAALSLQEKYQEVMVDEYQDINGIQEAILSLLVKPEAHDFFAVGDVKQSIYRFRLSDPSLFLQKYGAYQEGSERGEACARIDLTRNFRSRPEVLSAINFIFAQVMTPETMELFYDDAAALHPGPGYPPAEGETLAGPVELVIIGKKAAGGREQPAQEGPDSPQELEGFALEAQHIALRLQGLMESKVQVFDKAAGGYRPVHWRDMVVLLRAASGRADVLLEAMRAHNIPAYAEVDSGYFEETEIRIMLSLLSILDNARQDIPLAAVLYSPMVGMSMPELAELRLAAPEEDLFTALMQANNPEIQLPEALRAKASEFLRHLSGWRSLAQQLSVPELIWQLYRDTGYYDYVGAMPGGLLRQANLRMLCDRAEAYERTNFRGLFRFLRFVEKMQGMENDLSVARTLGESEDVVRIMSIHKSKGLEFPVVVLANCGKSFNLRDSSESFLLHSSLGVGPKRVEPEKSIAYPTFARQAIASKIVQETKAEEQRLLYVALTRAREKLILTGTVSDVGAAASRWCRYASRKTLQVPEYAALSASSYLDWICTALARHPDGAPLRDAADLLEPPAVLEYDMSAHWLVSVLSPEDISSAAEEEPETSALLDKLRAREPLSPGGHPERVCAVLAWQYDMRGMEEVPAKLSVTELKRRFSEQEAVDTPLLAPEPVFRRPSFAREPHGLTGTEYGTIVHSVMQHLELGADLSAAGIEKQLDAMVQREILLPEQRAAVRTANIAGFFSSMPGKRLLSASRFWRELPFSRMLSARRFYPKAVDEAEKIFSQGIIDLLFEEPDGLVLLDYKTDKETNAEKVRTRYQLQINLYSEAVQELLHRTVKERYLYMMHDGSVIKL